MTDADTESTEADRDKHKRQPSTLLPPTGNDEAHDYALGSRLFHRYLHRYLHTCTGTCGACG
eukprot:scaffold13107_cov140-Isochrysis_galbana.AAC.1